MADKENPLRVTLYLRYSEAQQELLRQGEELLRKFRHGRVQFDEINAFADKPAHQFLSNKEKALDDKTPLACLREIIDSETKAGQEPKRKVITGAANKLPGPKTKPIDEYMTINFAILRSSDEIHALPPTVTTIHLTCQDVISERTIKDLKRLYPGLNTIQMGPSFRRLISDAGEQRLKVLGIEVRLERIKDSRYYDEVPQPQSVDEKRKFFEKIKVNPTAQSVIEKMRYLEFDELQIAEMHLVNKLSTREIGQKTGYGQRTVEKMLIRFYRWFNFESGQSEWSPSRRFLSKLERLIQAEQSEKSKLELQLKYSIGGQKPPFSLGVKHWQNWNQIKIMQHRSDVKLEELKKKNNLAYTALFLFYQIDFESPTKVTYRNIASEIGRTHERARQLVNFAVDFLSLSDDS